MGAAAFVLIIACANVTNLTLMRGVRREHELTVRAALGAGTVRLRRLLLTENLLLALMGAALGLLIAFAGVRMLISFAERYSARAGEIRVDGMVLGSRSDSPWWSHSSCRTRRNSRRSTCLDARSHRVAGARRAV